MLCTVDVVVLHHGIHIFDTCIYIRCCWFVYCIGFAGTLFVLHIVILSFGGDSGGVRSLGFMGTWVSGYRII